MFICLDHSLIDRKVVLNSFYYFQWPNWKQLASAIHKAIYLGIDQGSPFSPASPRYPDNYWRHGQTVPVAYMLLKQLVMLYIIAA